MELYLANFIRLDQESLINFDNPFSWGALFNLYQWIIANTWSNENVFIITTFFIINLIYIISIKKIVGPYNLFLIWFLYMCFPFYYAYIFNTIRQGFSLGILMIIISIIVTKKGKFTKGEGFFIIVLFGMMYLFHESSLLVILTIIIILFVKINLNKALVIWFISSFVSLTNTNLQLLKLPFINNIGYINTYTSSEVISVYSSTNRIDFWLFSSIFLVWGLVFKRFLVKERYHYNLYKSILVYYIVFNSLYNFLAFVAFSDRIAIYSWILIPIIISYPILMSNNKYKNLLLITISSIFIIVWYLSGSQYFL